MGQQDRTPQNKPLTVLEIAEALIRSADPGRVPEFVAWLGTEESDGSEVYFGVTGTVERTDGGLEFTLEPLR